MDAAVVELDALADAVRAAAEDHHLLLGGRTDLGLVAVGGVEVRREGFEFRGAGVDETEDRLDPGGVALGVDRSGREAGRMGDLAVGETGFLGLTKQVGGDGLAGGLERELDVDDAAELAQEPRVDLREVEDLLLGQAGEHRVADEERTFRIRAGEARADLGEVGAGGVAELAAATEAPGADLEGAERLLEGFLERTADGHRLADGLHRGGERGVGADELLEREARDLGDDVVDRRLEAGRRGLGDVVLELVERVADGELGGDLGDREAGGLGGEGGRTRHARVHLDHDHAAVLRVDGELDVGAARLDADGADDGERGVAHQLVFLVGQRERGGDGDGVAGVDAHRVEVLDRTDDDALVLVVPHHFHLVFLPAEQALLDEDLVDGRGVEAGLGHALELLAVVGDAAAGAAEGVGRADDDRELAADQGDGLTRGVERLDHAGAGHVEADLEHQLLEDLAVFAAFDRRFLGADQLDAVFGEDAGAGELEREVERGLAAERREQRVRLLLGDDAFHGFDREGLHVGDVRRLGVRHDRGGVRVHQDDAVAFFAQGLASLGAGIIELAGLADDDRSRADDED